MTTVLVIEGSADPHQLTQALPGVRVEVLDRLPAASHPAVAAVVRSGTRLSAHHLDRLPALRHVVRPGSGTDNIDLPALAARGVNLHRNPAANAAAVAEWTLLAALSLTRRVALGHNGLIAGRHLKAACLGPHLAEQRLAIWGAGPVGLAIGQALGPAVKNLAYAAWPSNPPHLPQRPAELLAGWADLHVVALPLRETTRAAFNPPWLAEAGRHRPALICVGRVETLDLPACLDALDADTLSGLAIDAIDPEHVASLTRLGEPRNLLLTPHVGAQRADVRRVLDHWAAQTLRTALLAGRGEGG
ncbi:NAD(P)-dependent oxidoreductase [Micromonospora sp. C28SCA-DRY-2]|uniref:NAD(P)-dependent oxidoreductase n=1 Tax=Micromonospora sp. C28SCA-DRY-2 TaxID=3059522 RepID=UPI0026773E4B|nr:NAD(P)-dependent oxidoreductase [Micromonospora sp. C28SCA-DRY-2]MDO3704057.1 NAD(P)-dependent oxidoreductase [Micromonospora sp. C28SCA-DRY-2]